MPGTGRAIVFLSDFGYRNEWVGICHAVINRISPTSPIIDLSHGVPPLDVLETDDALEICVDLPGVPFDAVRIVAKGQTLLIAGHKAPRRSRPDSSFHLVERGYGRFVRVVQLTATCDTSRAHASMSDGELRISIPRTSERRGRSIRIPIPSEPPAA